MQRKAALGDPVSAKCYLDTHSFLVSTAALVLGNWTTGRKATACVNYAV